MIGTDKTATRLVGQISNILRRKLDGISFRGVYSGAQGRALRFLLMHTDIDVFQKDIEEEYALRSSTATDLLKKMEQNNLIVRKPVSYDARLKKIMVSDTAMEYKEQVTNNLAKLEKELTDGISREDMEVFTKVIEKMISNIK